MDGPGSSRASPISAWALAPFRIRAISNWLRRLDQSAPPLERQGAKEAHRPSRALGNARPHQEPGFQRVQGFEAWTPFDFGTRSQFELDTNVVRQGRQAYRVTTSEPSRSGDFQDIRLKTGHWYRCSGWVRTRGLDPLGASVYGTICIQWPPGNRGMIAAGTNHGGDTEWTGVSMTFQATRKVD